MKFRRGGMIKNFLVIGIAILFFNGLAYGLEQEIKQMKFSLVSESPKLTDIPIELFVASDLNGNNIPEIIMANFGPNTNLQNRLLGEEAMPSEFILMIWEWDKKAMKMKWNRKWPVPSMKEFRSEDFIGFRESYKYYQMINMTLMLNTWKIGGHEVIESRPPHFNIQWGNGSYQWKEQLASKSGKNLIGSWIFPFESPLCHSGLSFVKPAFIPHECILSVWNFGDKIGLRIITQFVESNGSKPARLRVRKISKDFPIEWETTIEEPIRYADVFDQFNNQMHGDLLIRTYPSRWILLVPHKNGYSIEKVTGDSDVFKFEPQIIGGRTIQKNILEYWGFRRVGTNEGRPVREFQVISINLGEKHVIKKDIYFPVLKKFIGVGSFALGDLDGDGLDEVVFVEQTGDRIIHEEEIEYKNVADYIRVIKWDGKGYQPVWTSPPLKDRGSKILVEGVMGNGKNQIVVGTGQGTLQIWEQK
jgi:hypothetical protein